MSFLVRAADTAVSLAECRGPFIPNAADDIATFKVKVTNQGPGPMYAIALMRENTFLGSNPDDPADDVTGYSTYKSTYLIDANKEVLLPGESFIFEDYVDCADTFSMTITRAGAWTGTPSSTSTSKAVNVHAQPFMTLTYQVDSMDDTVGSCMAVDSNGRLNLVEGGTCPNTYSPGESCVGGTKTGECYYSHVEPRRTASFLVNKDGSRLTVRQANITVTYVSPH